MFDNFNEYVKNFDNFKSKQALVIKPFLKVRRLNYGQLQDKVYQTANYLISQGIKKDDRVMIVAANCPEWIEVFLGCQLIGAILVPVDARNTLEMALKFAARTEPKIVFRSKPILPKLNKKYRVILLEDLEDLVTVCPITPPKVELTGKETAVIVFTSGTTAEPKGVVLSQKNILSNVDGVNEAINIDPDWRILSVLPLSHMYEMIGVCCLMSKSCTIYYLPMVAPLAISRALKEYRITTILAVPQLLILLRARILQTAADEGLATSLNAALRIAPFLPFKTRRLLFRKVHEQLGGCLKLVITGGAPIPPEVAVFWENMGMKAIEGYGLTETSPILSVNRLYERHLKSQGLLLYNVKARVSDVGEIQSKGPSVFSSYWNNPEQTNLAFTDDGWFKTGDIGQIKNGWLQIQGRAKFAIILSSGLNVFPEDVELIAEKHKVFKEICVVGVRTKSGEKVHAVVISDKKDKHIVKAIKEVNSKLEEFQHISDWSRWPDSEFPRTLILKIDRKNVQAWANQELLNSKVKMKPKNNGDVLLKILRSSLDDPKCEINEKDRLSDIGLDSLRRLAMVSAIEEQLSIYIPESKIDQKTTLKDLRKLIAHGSHVENKVKRPKWQFNKTVRLAGVTLRETLARALVRIYIKIDVEGRENICNLDQPAIFIFNHVDAYDVPVLYQALPRNIRNKVAVAAADDVLDNHKVLTLVARLGYASYNLDRNGMILSSLEYTSDLIDKGWSIAMAPEGHVSKDGRLQHFKSGIGLLAVETGVPIVLVKTIGLAGTLPLDKKWPQHSSRVVVKIGPPIIFDKNTSYNKATKKLYKVMKKL